MKAALPFLLGLVLVTAGCTGYSSVREIRPAHRSPTAAGEVMEMPVHWGNDDWRPFAHYAEIGYLMPVRAPSPMPAALSM